MADSIQSRRKDIAEFISELMSGDSSRLYVGDMDKYTRIDKLVTANQLDTDEDFEFIVRNNRYALLSDIDGDKKKELIFLQIEGTGYFPHFFIYKFDKTKKIYRPLQQIDDKYLYPITFKNHLYFIDIAENYDAKRLTFITAYEITKKFDLVKQISVKVNYSYQIPDTLKPYINDDFLESLPKYELEHFSKRKFLTFNKDKHCIAFDNKDTITYKIDYTSVGYRPSTISFGLQQHDGGSIKFDYIFCFDIVQHNGKEFLVISSYDDRVVYSGTVSMKITIISLSTLKVIITGYLNTDISLSGVP